MRTFIQGLVLAILLVGGFLSGSASAFTQIQLAPGASESVEQSLLQATSDQFLIDVKTNPFFPNTYNVTLHGLNPSFNPSPTSADLMKILPQYPFAAGMIYERDNDAGMVGYTMSLCDNATNFMPNPPQTWDPATCVQALGYIDNAIVFQSSGEAVLPDPLPGLK